VFIFSLPISRGQYLYEYDDEPFETDHCKFRSFADRSKIFFQARSYFSINRLVAISAFDALVDEFSRISDRRSLFQSGCSRDLKSFPCDLLLLDRDEEACQLALRATFIYQYISDRCSDEWSNQMAPLLADIQTAVRPRLASCQPPGVKL